VNPSASPEQVLYVWVILNMTFYRMLIESTLPEL